MATIAVLHVAHVHVAVAAFGEAAHTSHVLCKNPAGGDAADEVNGEGSRWEGSMTSSGPESSAGTDWNGFLSAADIDAADDFALPVELAFDSVFELTHHQHVVEALVRQGGLGGALVRLVPSQDLNRAHSR